VQSPRNGTIWVGSEQGEICRFESETGRCQSLFRNQDGMARGAVTALAATAAGTAAYGTQADGISYFDRERWQPLAVQGEQAAGNRVAVLASDAAGFIWAATDGGVQQINPSFTAANWAYTAANSDLAMDNVQTIYADDRGGVWLGGDGATYFDGEAWTHLTIDDGLVGPEVTAIVEDDQGRIWLGTRTGLSVWNGEDFFNLTRASGLPNDEITALATARNGVWIGTNGGGLYRFRDNQLQVFTAENAGLPSDAITALAAAPDGELFVGTDAGLARMVDGEVLPVEEVTAPVTSLATGPNDTLWAGTTGAGAAFFDGSAWLWLTEANGLPGRNIAAVAVDIYGVPWFGAASGGFVRGFTQTGAN
jgi:ligand-binding sensor domain-containing protein